MIDLQKLKNDVLDELITITDEGDLSAEDKFQVVMMRYINGGDIELLDTAYKAAQQIKDATVKGNALIQLAEEIDIAQTEQQDTATKIPQNTDSDVDTKNQGDKSVDTATEQKTTIPVASEE